MARAFGLAALFALAGPHPAIADEGAETNT
jgi:hypothetical protein